MACSDSYLRKQMQRLLDEVGKWGDAQQTRLAADMPKRSLSIGADETFFEDMILVAADLVSGFLLVEKPSDKRDAETWKHVFDEGLKGLNVYLVQLVGDAASQLRKLAKDLLGIPKVDELFHAQMAISRGTAAPLSANVRKLNNELTKATDAVAKVRQDRAAYEATTHGPGRPPNWDNRETKAIAYQQQVKEDLKQAAKLQEEMRQANRSLSTAVNPVNIESGAPQDAAAVQQQLEQTFETIEAVADEASLPESSYAKIRPS